MELRCSVEEHTVENIYQVKSPFCIVPSQVKSPPNSVIFANESISIFQWNFFIRSHLVKWSCSLSSMRKQPFRLEQSLQEMGNCITSPDQKSAPLWFFRLLALWQN